MKLRRLELRRYGHLSDVVLDFPAEASLCVVHGANEAGKSTALAALGDALFGFRDLRSGPRPDFLHGAPQLRIGLTMRARNGEEIAVVRRKGRANTLTDEAGATIADDVMRRFLGSAGRDTFENTFGLNGERLREGGKVLAQGGGSVGESLFAAGTGLLGLRAALTRLDDEAKTLVGRANAARKLNVAMDRWRQAQKDIERLSVPPRAWIEADAAYADAVASLSRVQGEVEGFRREESLLQRLRRVAPLLVQLDASRRTAAELADTPLLPADAGDVLHSQCAARDEAMRDREREEREVSRLASIRDVLSRSPELIAAQDAIDRLTEQRPVAVQAEADRPGVALEVQRLRMQVVQAMADLGPGATPEAARDALPSPSTRSAVQRLINRHAALLATEAAASQERDAAGLRRDKACAALQASVAPADPALLRLAIDGARAEGRVDQELAQADGLAEVARARANEALASLPRWTGSFAALLARPLPLTADEAGMAGQLAAAESKVAQAEAARDRLATEIQVLEDSLAGFGPGDSIPTPDAVRVARASRDGVWRTVRRILDSGAPLPSDEPSKPLSVEFEGLQAEADKMADRRADEAQRVADYLQARSRLALLQARQTATAQTLGEAERQLAEAKAGWRALWSAALDDPGPPAAMAEWRRTRDEAVALSRVAHEAERARDGLRCQRDAAWDALLAVLPDLTRGKTLAAVLARADLVCTRREKAAELHRGLQDAAEREALAVDSEASKVRSARLAVEAWRKEWAQAVAPLGLAEPCEVEEAEAALAGWARVAEAAPAWRSEEVRIGQMTRTIDAFAAEVGATMAAAGQADAGEPAPVAAARLARQLSEARSAEQEFADLSDRIEGHARAAKAARVRQAEAEAGIAALQALANVADVAGLEAVIVCARSRDEAEVEVARLLGRVIEEGDGFDEPALRQAAAGYDPDRAAARLDSIGEELGTLGEQREQWAAKRTRAEALLEAMQQGEDAATAAQDAHHALADARAAAGRYARLHVARELLRSGIDSFRRSQQGPLLQAAGRHFATLTGGRYERLAVDEDKDGRMLMLAVRDDGSECPVEALSEGTADQLYLALRVAMVEAHAASAEPLPFIADDLLVHFDDARAAAAIRLLTELGRTTQVVLFSHHDHVAKLAQAMASPEAAIIQLPGLEAGTALLEPPLVVV